MEFFTADAEAIRGHAAQIGSLADRMDTATQAVKSALDQNAFGIFGQFLAAGVVAAGAVTKAAMSGAAGSMDVVHAGLNGTADLYQRVEDGNADVFGPGGN